jgi:hypothetical protein
MNLPYDEGIAGISPILWLSLRGYRVQEVHIDLVNFTDMLTCSGDVSYTRCSLLMSQRGKANLPSLALLHLIEISHRLKRLFLYDDDKPTPPSWRRLLYYLAEHAQDVQEIHFQDFSAENMIEAMKLFPNLTSVTWLQA